MYRNLLLTESEKNEIKKLYGLLSEQTETSNPEITLDLAGTFGSGKYKLPEKSTKIDNLISKIRDFKNKNEGNVIEISINSGESQVPNYDREKYPSTGDKTKDFTPEKKLPVGELGRLRAQNLKSYLETNAPDLITDAEIVINEPVIGKEKWSGDDPNLEKYTKDQFVNLKIKATSEDKPNPKRCLINMEINFNYTDLSQRHRCNNATYKLYFTKSNVTSPTDEDLLIRNDGKDYASLDNNNSEFDNNPGTCTDPGKDDCKRYNKFIITNEIFERVGGSNLTPDSKFKIWAKCVGTEKEHQMFGTGCHYKNINVNYGIGEFKITNGKGDIIDFKVNTPIKKDIITLLSEIEPCGNPVIVKK